MRSVVLSTLSSNCSVSTAMWKSIFPTLSSLTRSDPHVKHHTEEPYVSSLVWFKWDLIWLISWWRFLLPFYRNHFAGAKINVESRMILTYFTNQKKNCSSIRCILQGNFNNIKPDLFIFTILSIIKSLNDSFMKYLFSFILHIFYMYEHF